jgi:hypothetical protein
MLTREACHIMRSLAASTAGRTPRRNRGDLRSVFAELSVKTGSALIRRFADWGEVFPNAACVVSLVDRLMHRAEVVRIEGESYRQKEADERVVQRAAARTAAARTKPASPRKPRA